MVVVSQIMTTFAPRIRKQTDKGMQIEAKLTNAIQAAIQSLYGQEVPEKMVQLSATKKEFEGHLTLVVFPFLKMSRKAPEATAQEIGEYLTANLPDVVARFNADTQAVIANLKKEYPYINA